MRLLACPCWPGERLWGVVSISSIIPGRTFTADEIRLAETVAGQIAGAIANAQLFEEEKRQRLENARLFEAEHAALERAETLYAVSLALSAALELTDVLDLILIELRRVIRAVANFDYAPVTNRQGNAECARILAYEIRATFERS